MREIMKRLKKFRRSSKKKQHNNEDKDFSQIKIKNLKENLKYNKNEQEEEHDDVKIAWWYRKQLGLRQKTVSINSYTKDE